MPDPDAGCPLADFLTPAMIQRAKEQYPKAAVVLVHQQHRGMQGSLDSVCTSGMQSGRQILLPRGQIIFGPDANLASYVQSVLPEKEIIAVPEDGHCYVHTQFDPDDLQE
jgi:quinolinate synthase